MKTAKKILILSANPKTTSRLRLDEEVREIEAGLQRSRYRDNFTISHKWAIRLKDLRRALLDHEPHIVHFCGHGEVDGLMVESEDGSVALVRPEALAGLFELFAHHVEYVMLNACYSSVQAEAISKYIKYVVGMKKDISDQAALEFAVGFYDALGAGKSIEEAFKFGCNALQLYQIPEHLTPVLKKKTGTLTQIVNIFTRINTVISNIYHERAYDEFRDHWVTEEGYNYQRYEDAVFQLQIELKLELQRFTKKHLCIVFSLFPDFKTWLSLITKIIVENTRFDANITTPYKKLFDELFLRTKRYIQELERATVNTTIYNILEDDYGEENEFVYGDI